MGSMLLATGDAPIETRFLLGNAMTLEHYRDVDVIFTLEQN